MQIDKNKKSPSPRRTSKARRLLYKRKATLLKLHPFTILIKGREENVKDAKLKIDPRSHTTRRGSKQFCHNTLDKKVNGISHRYRQNIQQTDVYRYLSKKLKIRSSVSPSS